MRLRRTVFGAVTKFGWQLKKVANIRQPGRYTKPTFYPEGEEECYIFPCYVTSDGQVKHERSKGQFLNDVQTAGRTNNDKCQCLRRVGGAKMKEFCRLHLSIAPDRRLP